MQFRSLAHNDWIDAYKELVYWDALFGDDNSPYTNKAPKFHNIPHAMQMGIWITFEIDYINENELSQYCIMPLEEYDLREAISNFIENTIQRRIDEAREDDEFGVE